MMDKKGNLTIGMVVLALLTLVGLGAWAFQLVNGLGVTGMNNVVSWGSYIAMFMLFVGLSAGGLIVSSSATVFNIPSFKVVAKPAVILSTVCIIIAGVFIIVDIGSPWRIYNLILHPQFRSPLMWDVVVISLYLALNLVYLYFMSRSEPDERKLKIISRIALPTAVLVHSVTAWIFGLQIAREGWHSALMAPLFVASALDSGLALLIIALLALNRLKVFEVEKKLISTLAGLLVTCVAVDAFFVFSEVLTMFYPGEESAMLVLREMTSGFAAPFFWGEIILGFILPLMILVFKKNRENTNCVMFASVIVILGVFCKRVWLLFSSFIHPNVQGAPGVTYGKFTETMGDMWSLQGSYAPTWVELAIIIGMLSMGALLFTYLSNRFLLGRTDFIPTVKSGQAAENK
ncbi:molybdopterin-containing oxidoreductase family membrane subunit [Desulfitobacterium sp. LBE]|uniref:Molybdoperin oxidoreductase, chain C n=3 Tax=Desulfitobacteriaceae TaxID=2937909 RepID=A0A098B4T8_DESHA|nr:molybdopterin-containing oxidoreductase family membrane subunit [Desulfitobacterium sp. LBE]BAE85511.1 putative oxidoreductase membrane subunit [Desulfitobacterium hafniense Y51]CDX03888.1 Molybdoperin oxidoreductase, chain C [Desulfitobacterium hafniense]